MRQTDNGNGGHGAGGETARLETYSDGVFSISATLLVLNCIEGADARRRAW